MRAQPRRKARAVHQRDHGCGRDDHREPGPARKRKEDPRRNQGEPRRREERHARAPADEVVQQVERARNEERAEHVGVLEDAGRAPVHLEEDAVEEVVIARDAGSRREKAAREISLEDELDSLGRVVGEEHCEEDRGQHQVDRLVGPLDGARLVEIGQERDQKAEVIGEQQRDEGYRAAMQADAETEPQRHRRDREEIVGRGPQEGEADEEDEGGEKRIGERLDEADGGKARPAPRPRKQDPGVGDAHSASPVRPSVRVFRLQQREGGHRDDVEVEEHRPVLDVIEVELYATLDLLLGVGLAAPAVDLRPSR